MGMRHGWEHYQPLASLPAVPEPVELVETYPTAAALAEEWETEQQAFVQRGQFRVISGTRDPRPLQVA
jgi:hypothetical protein